MKARVTLSIGFANSKLDEEINIPDEEWETCKTNDDREELKDMYWKDWAWDYIDGSITVEDGKAVNDERKDL